MFKIAMQILRQVRWIVEVYSDKYYKVSHYFFHFLIQFQYLSRHFSLFIQICFIYFFNKSIIYYLF